MRRLLAVVIPIIVLLGGCSEQSQDKPMATDVANLPEPATLPAADEYPAQLIMVAYSQLAKAAEAAEALLSSARSLQKRASGKTLNEARKHWRAGYSAYLASLAAANTPVREPTEWYAAGLTRVHLAKQINSWPIEPGYIDYLKGYPFTGIVNDTTLSIDRDSLLSQHLFSDSSYVAVGYHALEFILWGEDGKRPASDFDVTATLPDADDGIAAPVLHQQRRTDYLITLTQLLIDDLKRLQMRWAPDRGHYAQTLTTATPAETLQASLLTVTRLIEQDLLQHYLTDLGSSPYSAGTPMDVQALLMGVRQILLPESLQAGLVPLLPPHQNDTPNPLLNQLRSNLSDDSACSAGWQTATSYIEGQAACRQQMLELLITLKEISDELGLQVPVSG